MKKFLLFQLVLMLSLPALAEEPFSFETRKVPVNRGGEVDGTVSLRFYKDMPSVPYISVADFQELMLPGTTIVVSKTGEGEYLLEGPYAKATVNTVTEQFSSDNYMAFTNLMGQLREGMDNVYYDGAPFIRYNRQELTPASATVTFDFKKYGIDLRGNNKTVYFPFATLSDLYSDLYYHVAGYTGDKVVIVTDNQNEKISVIEPENAERLLEADTRDEDMAAFSYAELCFVIDHFYGMPGRSPLESGIQNDGLDKTLDTVENGPLIKKLLKSTDMEDYLIGMKSLQVLLDDGGHTNLMVDMDLFSITMGDEDLAGEAWNERNDKIQYKYPELYGSLTEYFNKLEEQNSKLQDIDIYRPYIDTYHKEGKTAFLMLNTFGFTNMKAWNEYYKGGCIGETPAIDEEFKGDLSVVLDALKQASEDPEVKNFVVDLTCNLGGSLDVVMAMTALMGGQSHFYSENTLTGQRQKIYYDVDCNFDGVFDEKDKEVMYDLNIAVLTSDVAFSCANLFPSLMKDMGFPIIGERTGGGSCAVQNIVTPEGFQYQISSARGRLTNNKWENIDGGVEPDYVIDVSSGDYSNFYDVATINAFINKYCTSPNSIIDLNATSQDGTCVYYDLSGRKIDGRGVKGVYILKGKKIAK